MQNEEYAKEVEAIRAAVLDLWKLQQDPMAFGENMRDATIVGHITKLESYAKKSAMKFFKASKNFPKDITPEERFGFETDNNEWGNEVPSVRSFSEWGGRRTKRAKKAKRARKTKRLYKKI